LLVTPRAESAITLVCYHVNWGLIMIFLDCFASIAKTDKNNNPLIFKE